MSTHVIVWHDTRNGQRKAGTKLFTETEATALCKELNLAHPEIIHAPKPVDGPMPDLSRKEPEPKPVTAPVFQPLGDEDLFPFGQHKGVRMRKVPASFLDWYDGQPWSGNWPAVKDYVARNRVAINQDLNRSER